MRFWIDCFGSIPSLCSRRRRIRLSWDNRGELGVMIRGVTVSFDIVVGVAAIVLMVSDDDLLSPLVFCCSGDIVQCYEMFIVVMLKLTVMQIWDVMLMYFCGIEIWFALVLPVITKTVPEEVKGRNVELSRDALTQKWELNGDSECKIRPASKRNIRDQNPESWLSLVGSQFMKPT